MKYLLRFIWLTILIVCPITSEACDPGYLKIMFNQNQTKIKVELADEPSATPVTNFIYESDLNENRKQIKLLDGAYLTAFISEFKLLLQNGN